MADSTTLITFAVRTPPTARSVDLYGSWDNFSTPCPMSRDVRIGLEHWSGCHSFRNIVCDDDLDSLDLSQDGTLRMGGTYWYYYKMDDQIEFHNSAEPSSTHCPLLPGHLVNMLHIPLAVDDNKSQKSSANPTQFTFNEGSKFVNWRSHPAPKLQKLNTSPTVVKPLPSHKHQLSGSVSAKPAMHLDIEKQSSVCSSRVFHLPRKPSLDALLKVRSTEKSSAGVRPTRNVSDAMPDAMPYEGKYQEIINWIPEREVSIPQTAIAASGPSLISEKPKQQPRRGSLLLRSNSEEAVPLASFAAHRRQHSRSRSQTRSNRSSSVIDETGHLHLHGKRTADQAPLSALFEVNSPECTPAHGPMTGRRIALEALEGRSDEARPAQKRLPTLPNTPSSAYPESMGVRSTSHGSRLLQTDPNSRFSSTTIDSSNATEKQRNSFLSFSESAFSSPDSEAIFDDQINALPSSKFFTHPVLRPISSNPAALPRANTEFRTPLFSAMTCTTIDCSPSTTPTTSHIESDLTETSLPSRTTSICSPDAASKHVLHYSLPYSEKSSSPTVKVPTVHEYPVEDSMSAETVHQRHDSTLSYTKEMKELFDELNYLSQQIHN